MGVQNLSLQHIRFGIEEDDLLQLEQLLGFTEQVKTETEHIGANAVLDFLRRHALFGPSFNEQLLRLYHLLVEYQQITGHPRFGRGSEEAKETKEDIITLVKTIQKSLAKGINLIGQMAAKARAHQQDERLLQKKVLDYVKKVNPPSAGARRLDKLLVDTQTILDQLCRIADRVQEEMNAVYTALRDKIGKDVVSILEKSYAGEDVTLPSLMGQVRKLLESIAIMIHEAEAERSLIQMDASKEDAIRGILVGILSEEREYRRIREEDVKKMKSAA